MPTPTKARPLRALALLGLALGIAGVAHARSLGPEAGSERGREQRGTEVSPLLGIEHPEGRATRPPDPRPRPFLVRSIDGSGNNREDPEMGASFTVLRRRLPADYADGVSVLAGQERPNPRAISSLVNAQEGSVPDPRRASDYLWQWGQFLDHDIDLTDGADPPEPAPIAVPAGDAWFDPDATGEASIAFNRSLHDEGTGTGPGDPREQLNEITAWIDASNVYGSDEERASALRAHDGSGRLATEGDLLPRNEKDLPNAGGPSPALFLAGDVRANEQVGLTAMHTLFVREHNLLAGRIARESPGLSGDEIYERARRLVGAEMQAITYREFLPALLGRDALEPYRGYRPEVDGRIANLFATAAFRLGHSMLSPTLLRLDARGREIPAGHLPLRDAFFAPEELRAHGIEPLLRGLARQVCQRVDVFVVDEVRNFLFDEDPADGGFDLAALNIQRGRDHGLPSYNDARRLLGLPPARDFGDVSSDGLVQQRLAEAHASVEDVDLWVGGLAEDPVPGSHLGPLFFTIVKEQFEALRDGDRFWYERVLTGPERRDVEATRLSDVIRRNTRIADEIPDDVFRVSGRRDGDRGAPTDDLLLAGGAPPPR
ncbi:MAG: peroxidase family protein [Myxococcota bacterium]|nr:peroxidase family protein [Myxococcota bacterium]